MSETKPDDSPEFDRSVTLAADCLVEMSDSPDEAVKDLQARLPCDDDGRIKEALAYIRYEYGGSR